MLDRQQEPVHLQVIGEDPLEGIQLRESYRMDEQSNECVCPTNNDNDNDTFE